MENEHLEAKSRLDEIKRVLVDSDKSTPAPSGMFYTIGIASIFLDIAVDRIFTCRESSFTLQLTVALITLVSVFLFTVLASKKFVIMENEKLDRVFSKNQRFTFEVYGITLLIGVAITMGSASVGGWPFIYLYWMALMGAAAYVFGFFTKKLISRFGALLIFAAILQIIIAVIYINMNVKPACNAAINGANYYVDIYTLTQYSSIVLVGFGHILVGYLLGKNKNV